MCSNYLISDFDEIFENETNDIHSDLLSDDNLLFSNDLLNLNSNDFNFDALNDDNLYDCVHDKFKGKQSDFESSLADFNHLLKDVSDSQQVKMEPTNSVSSTYLTDESSHPSSINSSPSSGKIRKRDHTVLDSSSEKSFALNDEFLDVPTKTSKFELIKTSVAPKIYKLTKDIKSEPIYINSVTIRHGGHPTPYVVHKLPSGVKTVNIRPQKAEATFLRAPPPPPPELDRDFTDFYDADRDSYPPKSRTNSYYHQTTYSQSNSGKSIYQSSVPQVGPLHLTEEEKRTLVAEGYTIPTRLPLTKQDERNLKKVRRKIKNKISAQESRRKKKEYVDALEKKNEQLQRRNESLETANMSLLSRNRHLEQQLMSKVTSRPASGTSTTLMLFMVCFAVLLMGGSVPSSSLSSSLSSPQGSALYYMGYGGSRGNLSWVGAGPMYGWQPRGGPDNGSAGLLSPSGPIVPRRSILLGDDADDRGREGYLKHGLRVCGRSAVFG